VAVNSFRPRKFEDFEIVDDDNRVVGHIRVKPSGVLWAPSNAKVWYGVSLARCSSRSPTSGARFSLSAGARFSLPAGVRFSLRLCSWTRFIKMRRNHNRNALFRPLC